MVHIGTVLENRYIVKRKLGEGGEGAVYEAEDQRLGKIVALKEIFSTQDWARNVFEAQARLLAKLEHPALPIVTDFFTDSSGQFLVMQFIPGPDLATMLEERGALFPVDDTLRWADQLLDVLDYLHTYPQPIIHRDIKPQNLKINRRGQIMLLDFGLAKDMTVGTIIRGISPNYSPLEQVQFRATDARSDIYALAATLYHVLTRLPPPDAETRSTLDPDPLRPAHEINPDVPSGVAEILMRCMTLDINKRIATVAELRERLSDSRKSVPLDNTSVTVIADGVSRRPATQDSSTDERELFVIRTATLYVGLGDYQLRNLHVGERLIKKEEKGSMYKVFTQSGEEGWVYSTCISFSDPKSYFNLIAGSKTVKGFLRTFDGEIDNVVLREEEFDADVSVPIRDILDMTIQWPKAQATLRDDTKISGLFTNSASFIFGENAKVRAGYGTTLDLQTLKLQIELKAIEQF
jgi:serine/threonine protein kinase